MYIVLQPTLKTTITGNEFAPSGPARQQPCTYIHIKLQSGALDNCCPDIFYYQL